MGGGLFCCLFLFPLCQVGGPDRFFQSGGELEKFNAHVCFSPFAGIQLATLYRVACCGTNLARYRVTCQALYRAFYVLHKTLYRVFVQIDTVQGWAKMLYFIYKNKQG